MNCRYTSGIRNVVKPCVGPIFFFFWALCFLSARNDIDSTYKELCNCCADLIRIQGLTLGLLPVSPTSGYKETGKRRSEQCEDSDVKPTLKRGHCAVDTLEVRSKIGRFDTCNGNAKSARAFPGVTESTV